MDEAQRLADDIRELLEAAVADSTQAQKVLRLGRGLLDLIKKAQEILKDANASKAVVQSRLDTITELRKSLQEAEKNWGSPTKEELVSANTELETGLKKLRSQVDELNTELGQAQSSLTAANSDWQKKVDDLNIEKGQLQGQNTLLTKQNQNHVTAHTSLASSSGAKDATIEDLRKQLATLSTNVEEEKSKNNQMRSQLSSLATDRNNWKQRAEQAENEAEPLHALVAELEKKKEQLIQENGSLQVQYDDLVGKNFMTQDQLAELLGFDTTEFGSFLQAMSTDHTATIQDAFKRWIGPEPTVKPLDPLMNIINKATNKALRTGGRRAQNARPSSRNPAAFSMTQTDFEEEDDQDVRPPTAGSFGYGSYQPYGLTFPTYEPSLTNRGRRSADERPSTSDSAAEERPGEKYQRTGASDSMRTASGQQQQRFANPWLDRFPPASSSPMDHSASHVSTAGTAGIAPYSPGNDLGGVSAEPSYDPQNGPLQSFDFNIPGPLLGMGAHNYSDRGDTAFGGQYGIQGHSSAIIPSASSSNPSLPILQAGRGALLPHGGMFGMAAFQQHAPTSGTQLPGYQSTAAAGGLAPHIGGTQMLGGLGAQQHGQMALQQQQQQPLSSNPTQPPPDGMLRIRIDSESRIDNSVLQEDIKKYLKTAAEDGYRKRWIKKYTNLGSIGACICVFGKERIANVDFTFRDTRTRCETCERKNRQCLIYENMSALLLIAPTAEEQQGQAAHDAQNDAAEAAGLT